MDSQGGAHDLESLVFECLERFETHGESALDDLCREHPEHAAGLRERIALLRRMGLHGGPDGATNVPEKLGDFRLIERLGAGGMGVVYLAEQVSLRRPVALKLIRPEQLFFANARERFQREIDAIARLQHPSIVPIHATGTEGGIPYYAMEHVRGASLAQVLAAFAGRDPAQLTGRDLRELVVAAAPRGADPAGDLFVGAWSEVAAKIARALALAVQHAHERGVLHRDVKPSNVMVAADGRVVLLDFGLASLGESGALTRTGSQIGSLPYMAPEQLRARVEHVGARTDVYAIGVTLYEMLALSPAFVDPGDTEVLRARILSGRPRGLKELHHGISGDLALVCATAMQPEPADRYASAAALAADLENVLALRPIAARAPSAAARLRSWARRNPARATAAAFAFALVVGGPAVFALQQRAANRRVAAINVDLAAALKESELQRERAATERAAADRNLRKAVQAVDTMLTRVGQDVLRDVPQMVGVRRELLADALRFYADFLDEREGDPVLRRKVELARSRVSAMHMTLGDLDEALRELGATVDGLRAEADRPDADEETLRSFAEVVGRLGEIHARRDEFELAHERIAEALAAHERIPADRRTAYTELQRGGCHDKLGELEQRRGRFDEAERSARAAVDISRAGRARYPDQPSFALALGRQLDRLGTILVRTRRPELSLAPLEESVSVLETYRELAPTDSHGRGKLLAACINHANALYAVGRADEARARTEKAVELGDALVRDYPDVPSYRTDLAIAHLQLFVHAYRANELERAETMIRRAMELQDSVAKQRPSDSTFHAEVAGTCNNLAALQERLGRHDESLATVDRGIEHMERALAAAPEHPQWLDQRRAMNNNRGMTLVALGRWREAAASADRIEDGVSEAWHSCRAQLYERSSRLAAVDETLDEAQRTSEAEALRERALAQLWAAVAMGRAEWSELSHPDEWTSLRDDPRFVALVERSTKPR